MFPFRKRLLQFSHKGLFAGLKDQGMDRLRRVCAREVIRQNRHEPGGYLASALPNLPQELVNDTHLDLSLENTPVVPAKESQNAVTSFFRLGGGLPGNHSGAIGPNPIGVSSSQARRNLHRLRAIAAGALDGEEITAKEETSLVQVALQLRIHGAVICSLQDHDLRLVLCGPPTRRFCAEVLVKKWEVAAIKG